MGYSPVNSYIQSAGRSEVCEADSMSVMCFFFINSLSSLYLPEAAQSPRSGTMSSQYSQSISAPSGGELCLLSFFLLCFFCISYRTYPTYIYMSSFLCLLTSLYTYIYTACRLTGSVNMRNERSSSTISRSRNLSNGMEDMRRRRETRNQEKLDALNASPAKHKRGSLEESQLEGSSGDRLPQNHLVDPIHGKGLEQQQLQRDKNAPQQEAFACVRDVGGVQSTEGIEAPVLEQALPLVDVVYGIDQSMEGNNNSKPYSTFITAHPEPPSLNDYASTAALALLSSPLQPSLELPPASEHIPANQHLDDVPSVSSLQNGHSMSLEQGENESDQQGTEENVNLENARKEWAFLQARKEGAIRRMVEEEKAVLSKESAHGDTQQHADLPVMKPRTTGGKEQHSNAHMEQAIISQELDRQTTSEMRHTFENAEGTAVESFASTSRATPSLDNGLLPSPNPSSTAAPAMEPAISSQPLSSLPNSTHSSVPSASFPSVDNEMDEQQQKQRHHSALLQRQVEELRRRREQRPATSVHHPLHSVPEEGCTEAHGGGAIKSESNAPFSILSSSAPSHDSAPAPSSTPLSAALVRLDEEVAKLHCRRRTPSVPSTAPTVPAPKASLARRVGCER